MSTPTDTPPEDSTAPDKVLKGGCSAMACSVSDTPRTDAVAETLTYGRNSPFAEPMTKLARQLERELAQWKQNFIPFAAVHATRYGKDHYGKEGDLHFTHYDLLKEAGARMVDFKRCGDSQNVTTEATARR